MARTLDKAHEGKSKGEMKSSVAVVFSGGKDSTLAAFLLGQSGFSPVLVTFLPREKHSYMLHAENLHITKYIAEAMGYPHYTFEVSGEKEKEVEEMEVALSKLCTQGSLKKTCVGIGSGAIESEYQRWRLAAIADELGLASYNPLWKRSYEAELAYREMDVRFAKVAAEGLGKELLGEPITKLPKDFVGHRLFEGGEAETVVLDAPFFKKRIDVVEAEKVWHGSWGEWIIKKLELKEKDKEKEYGKEV